MLTSYEKDAWKDGKHRGLVSSEVTYLGILYPGILCVCSPNGVKMSFVVLLFSSKDNSHFNFPISGVGALFSVGCSPQPFPTHGGTFQYH